MTVINNNDNNSNNNTVTHNNSSNNNNDDVHIHISHNGHGSNFNTPVKTSVIPVKQATITPFNIDDIDSNDNDLLLKNDNNNSSTTTTQTQQQQHNNTFIQRRIITPFMNILQSGATPHGLSLSLSLGFVAGLFPIPFTTSVIVIVFVWLFKLNIAAAQLVNLLVTPLNLATFMLFIKYGDILFGIDNTVNITVEYITDDPINAVQLFGSSLLRGVVVWICITPILTAVLYITVKPVISTLMATMNKNKFSP